VSWKFENVVAEYYRFKWDANKSLLVKITKDKIFGEEIHLSLNADLNRVMFTQEKFNL